LNGKGGERAPDIATRPEIGRLSDSETLKVLRDGIPQKGMPPFATLYPAKLSEVLNYLRSLQGKGRAPAVTASTEKAKTFSPAKQAVRSAISLTVQVDFSAAIFPTTEQATAAMT
jgi:hypothetical protein